MLDELDRAAWAQQYRDPARAAALGREMAAHADAHIAARGHFHVAWAEMRWGSADSARAAHAQLAALAGDDPALQALERDLRAAWSRREHRFDDALTLLQVNLALDDELRPSTAHACSATGAGIAASSLHRMDDALRAFHRALSMAETSGDEALIANAVGNLGAAHYDVWNLEDALHFCRESQRRAADSGAQGSWVSATINLILTLAGLQRADEAQALVDELVAAAPRVRDDRRGKYATVFGDVARRRGEWSRAQALLDEAAAARAADEAPTLEWAATQAALHLACGALAAARELAEQRLERRTPANENDLPLAVLELREVAAQACEALGDLRAALDHQRAAMGVRERLLGRSASARRIAMEVELQLALARQQRDAATAERVRLAQINDALHAASRTKSDFFAAASHDLRQPVHALALQVAALRSEPDATQRMSRLDRIDACVGALSGLFDALLDLSRIDAGVVTPQWQPVALARLLDELVQTHRAEAEGQGLWLSLRLGAGAHEASARSDPLLLGRVLRNLIVNAARHTRAGGVLVTLRERGGAWRIDVRDSGPGIPAALHTRVFDEFFQIHPGERQGGEGLGLGLAIVQRLARLLGHGVTLRSAPGRGTTFSVSLERGVPAPRSLLADADTADALPPLRAIVIEDDRAAREALVDLLQQWGCSAIAAARSEDLPRDPSWLPDVALLDVRLGSGHEGRDGIDEAARLRAIHGASLPCLLITGESAPESLRRIEASGLAWLHKPVEVAGLRRWLAGVGAR